MGGVAGAALLTYQSEAPDAVDFTPYLRRLCREMEESLSPSGERVRIEVEAEEEATWGPDLVVALGLITGEAVTNALKHAFPGGREGRVRVILRAAGGGLMTLRVEDGGIGLPEGRREGSLGLKLVETLAKQIRGTARTEGNPGGGTEVPVTFPDPNASPG
jgi:two-component sensor histidine kinase